MARQNIFNALSILVASASFARSHEWVPFSRSFRYCFRYSFFFKPNGLSAFFPLSRCKEKSSGINESPSQYPMARSLYPSIHRFNTWFHILDTFSIYLPVLGRLLSSNIMHRTASLSLSPLASASLINFKPNIHNINLQQIPGLFFNRQNTSLQASICFANPL